MSATSGAFPPNGRGYNQSGGGYFYVVESALWPKLSTYSYGSGSGGATTAGAFTQTQVADSLGNVSSLFAAGKIVRDMGKTVISAGRSFRKIQAVQIGARSTGSVTGGAAAYPVPGYATFYVETSLTADDVDGAAGIVRFM